MWNRALKSLIAKVKSIGDLAGFLRPGPVRDLRQQGCERELPDADRTLEAELVAPAQHGPGVDRQRRQHGVHHLLTGLFTEGRQLGPESLEKRLTQLPPGLLAALDQRLMGGELAGGDLE